jgi:Lrp/AsnC family leucine-responsive transcriptional regulator
MDNIDKAILKILSENSMTSATEIGAAVNLSIPAVNKRIQKLKESGVIRSFTILTDEKKVAKQICAFIMLTVKYGEGVNALNDYLKKDTDVLECYAITGDYDYILKICARDVEALEEKLLTLKKLKGVIKSYTMLSLMEHKLSPTALPDINEPQTNL